MSESNTMVMALAIILAASMPADGVAQSRFQITPHVGMYFPLRAVVDEPAFQGAPLRKRQVGAVVLGGRVSYLAASHWSLEAAFNYSPSLVAVSQERRTYDAGGGVLLNSIRAVYRQGRSDDEKAPEVYLGWGGAVIHRFGEAWRAYTGTTDLAGVVGLGARVPLGGRTPINARFEIENYVSRVQFRGNLGGKTRARLNHDTVWSLGFEIPMIGDHQP